MRAVGRDRHRGVREADILGHLRRLGIGQVPGGHGRVDPHGAVAVGEQRLILREAVGRDSGRSVMTHEVHVKADRLLPLGAGELRLPLLIKPAAAVRVDEGRQERHVFAPAREAPQADAVRPL